MKHIADAKPNPKIWTFVRSTQFEIEDDFRQFVGKKWAKP
jgi:hypothetical protein